MFLVKIENVTWVVHVTYAASGGGNLKEIDHLEDLEVGGKVIVKLVK
jgi:hypothetical protein